MTTRVKDRQRWVLAAFKMGGVQYTDPHSNRTAWWLLNGDDVTNTMLWLREQGHIHQTEWTAEANRQLGMGVQLK